MIITGGKYRSRKLISPVEKIVKPTLSKVRESVFNMLFSRIDFEGKSFLDLFAGSGIMGFEAVSRGFERLVALDNNATNIALLNENARILGVKGKFIKYDALNFLKKADEKFDVIYIDPPYDTTLVAQALSLISDNKILNERGIIIVETKKDTQFDFNGFKLLKSAKYGLCQIYLLSK